MNNANSRTVHVVGAQETNYPWGFENKIIPAFRRLGYHVLSTDFRKNRNRLEEILSSQPADLFLVCRGEEIPPEVIRTLPGITALWYAEQLGTLESSDAHSEERRKELSFNVTSFDYLFSHDESTLPVYAKLGARRVSWLPTAVVDPSMNRRLALDPKYDVVFTGSMTPYRNHVLGELKKRGIHVTVVNSWDPQELNKIYNQSRITLNIHLSPLPNMESRITEVLGACGFLLSQELSSPHLVHDRQHYVSWTGGDVDELARTIRYFLENESERRAIADCGHAYVQSRHTVDQRITDLMNAVDFSIKSRIWPSQSFGVLRDSNGKKTLRLDDFYAGVRNAVQPQATTRPFNILLVAHNFLPQSNNGTEIHTYESAKELIRRGHSIRILYPRYTSEVPEGTLSEGTYEGIPISQVAVPREHEYRMKNPRVAEAVASYAASLNVDIVHFQHLIGVSAHAIPAVKSRNIRTVVTLRDGWLPCEQIHLVHAKGEYCHGGPESADKCADCFFARHSERLKEHEYATVRTSLDIRLKDAREAFQAADQIVVPSQFLRTVLEQSGFRHPRIDVIPHGVREFELHPWTQSKAGVRFAYLGSIYHTKGLDVAVQAFAAIDAKTAGLKIFGHYVDRAYLDRWMEEAKDDERIRYMGPYDTKDLGRILAETDIVVVPSRFESYCHVVRESLRAHVPVIGANIGGIPEAIQEGVNGLLFSPGDPVDLARAMNVFIEAPERVAEFRSRVQPVRNMKENIDDIERVYRDTVLGSARLIAFHLPQFHPIPENDAWWGRGFTEWTNVAKARPLFEGHYQPHIPADLSYYDLRLKESRQAQGELAREYGIEGFCFWHYWFNGKLLLEKPLVEMLKTGAPDTSFCLAWANEHWTRRWDGQEQEILQEQVYGGAEDDLAHFQWMLPFFRDQRAIRIDGKPVFLVYRPASIPDARIMVQRWKQHAEKAGLPGIFMIAIKTSFEATETSWLDVGFDGELLFQPNFRVTLDVAEQHRLLIGKERQGDDPIIVPYDKLWPQLSALGQRAAIDDRFFVSVVPGWDNTPRRARSPIVWHENTPEAFGQWLSSELERVRHRPLDRRIVFLNAWNEWAEGNHLEPDNRHGRRFLEATKNVLDRFSGIRPSSDGANSATASRAAKLSGAKREHLDVSSYRSLEEYRGTIARQRVEREKRAGEESREIKRGEKFTVAGHCVVCDADVAFLVDDQYSAERDGKRIPNWRERLICPRCQLNNRVRAAIHLFEQASGAGSDWSIYLTEHATPLYDVLRRHYPSLQASEFLGEHLPFGRSDARGIRNEDLTHLTFAPATFDAILSFEVFEHIPDYSSAIKECFRVLRPGGILFFTVPFAMGSQPHVVRATRQPDGRIEHLLSPEYHGDPLSDQGCLAYYHFGWQMLEDLRSIGFADPCVLGVWSKQFGYLGSEQLFFWATKPSGNAGIQRRSVGSGTAPFPTEALASAKGLHVARRLAEAKGLLEEIVRDHPAFADAQNELAFVLYELDDKDGAKRRLQYAVEHAPRDLTLLRNLVDLQLEEGKHEEVRDTCFRILAVVPDDVDAYFAIGSAMAGLKLLARAADYFGRVKRLQPDYPEIDNVLAALPDNVRTAATHPPKTKSTGI